MSAYLQRIGLDDVLRQRRPDISSDPMDWAVGLTRIQTAALSDEVTRKVVDIIDTFVHLPQISRSPMFILVSEMIENVHRHAATTHDGIAVAQVYPGQLKMGITFVDSGIGIRRSFLEGTPTIPTDPHWPDDEFLVRACELGVSSKATQHSGYGLYLLSRVVANNRGSFLLSSGRASLVGYLKNGAYTFDRYAHAAWDGTVVSIILDLHHKLSAIDVYRGMPSLQEGWGDDIFER